MKLARAALLGTLALSLSIAVASRAQAQPAVEAATRTQAEPAIEEATRFAVRPPVWEVTAGVRAMFVKSAGYDPFSTDDGLVQFSLTGTRVVLRRDRLSLVAGLALDVGGSSATARGAPSGLTLTRLAALAEGRYQPASRFYLFARLAPGLLHGSATINDASSPAASALSTDFDLFSLDASAGGAFCFGDIGMVHVGAWLVADGGYGWAPDQRLVLAPTLGADQSKAGPLDVGTLAARGGFFRISLALSY